jgi:hypothetical protein
LPLPIKGFLTLPTDLTLTGCHAQSQVPVFLFMALQWSRCGSGLVCVAEGYDDNFSHDVGISLLLFYATCCLLHVVLRISPSIAQILYILRLTRTVSRVKKLRLKTTTLTSTPILFLPLENYVFMTLNF